MKYGKEKKYHNFSKYLFFSGFIKAAVFSILLGLSFGVFKWSIYVNIVFIIAVTVSLLKLAVAQKYRKYKRD